MNKIISKKQMMEMAISKRKTIVEETSEIKIPADKINTLDPKTISDLKTKMPDTKIVVEEKDKSTRFEKLCKIVDKLSKNETKELTEYLKNKEK